MWRWLVSGVLAVLVSAVNAQTAPMIPKGVAGTYQLSYLGTTGTTIPYKVGDKVTFALNSTDGSLCVNGTKVTYGAMLTTSNVRYIHDSMDFVLVIEGATLKEIKIYKASKSLLHNPETSYGAFTGTKVSNDMGCGAGAAPPTLTLQEESVLDVAGDLYPTLFTQPSEVQSLDGYRYKFFAGSGLYIGFKNERLYGLGGPFGNNVTDLGLVSAMLTQLQAEKAKTFQNIPVGMQWTFNGQARSDAKAGVTISNVGFQSGSGKGLAVKLTAGSTFFPPGVQWTLEILSPVASPVYIPKGKHYCGLNAGAVARPLVADTNFLSWGSGPGCVIEFANDVSIGKPVLGTFRIEYGPTILVTGRFNVTP
jgi:hypothetical protein